MKQFVSFKKIKMPVWSANALAFLGLFIYIIQAFVFAHTTISDLDEGAYLLKGILFATGKYHPFDIGMYTNKAPFAFFIPGYAQLLFGAGLRTGRYLAVFFGVMAVIGTWVVSRRVSGKWLATAAVWVFALSPLLIKTYSYGVTQSSIACMLAWALVFSLGEGRSCWELILAGLLAGLMVMDRQNMVPVLPLLAIYAFWEHRWKAIGLLISGLAVVVLTHIAYWPAVLQLWNWVPFIRLPAEVDFSGRGLANKNPDISLLTRLASLFQTVRFYYVAMVGSIISFFLWPKFSGWKSRSDFRMSLFLLVLFWGLTIMHAISALGKDYCVFCLTPYVAFFNVAGILLTVVIVRSWNWHPSNINQFLLIIVLLFIFAGIGFSSSEDIGSSLLNFPAPRMRDLRILPGFVTWWDILSGKFHISRMLAMQVISTFFGFAVGGSGILIGYIIWHHTWHDRVKFGSFFAVVILALGLVMSPVLNGTSGAPDCNSDVILANEQIGSYLREVIPQGSLVYWAGGLSTAPLLYLPGVDIFPAQINGKYSYRNNDNNVEVNKFGFWNDEMKADWKATADFFIIENARYGAWKTFLSPDQFDEFERSPVGTSCSEVSHLRVFRRK